MAEADEVDIDQLVADLAAVQDQLLATASDDFARRYELNKRQDALREQVASFDPDAGRSRAEMEAEVAALRAQVDAIRKERIDVVKQAGGGSGRAEMGNLGGVAINQQIEQAQGVPQLLGRIGRLESRLAEMED